MTTKEKQTVSVDTEELKKLISSPIVERDYYLQGENLCKTINELVGLIMDRVDRNFGQEKKMPLNELDENAILELTYQISTIADIVQDMFGHEDFSTMEDFFYEIKNPG